MLNSIDLSFNSFAGEIPTAFQNLSRLTRLNLENNRLSGPIPDLKLPKLSHLNVRFNNLNGSIPLSLQSFPKDSFFGNQQLCGSPLPLCSALLPSPSPSFPSSPLHIVPSDHRQSLSKKFTIGVMIATIAAGLTLLILITIILLICVLKREDGESGDLTETKAVRERHEEECSSGVQGAERNKMAFFDGCSYNFDLEDLLMASAEVLGKGSYGKAYKAVLEDGTAVVVKRLKRVAAGKKDFEQQMEVVGKIGHHPNILPLLSYHYGKDEKLLVYEYSSGSFFKLLHGNRNSRRTPLNWDTRLKIMLGAAKAIAHIHSDAGVRFSHGNIKSSNILVTPDLHALVSDYGLAQLMSFHPPRADAYLAPEFMHTGKHTHETDVYSFGVVLLETLTGKSPVRAPGHEEIVDLPWWVQSVVQEEWSAEVFDAELLRFPNAEEEMVVMLQIALACTERDPQQRPVMEEVVGMLEDLRPTGSDCLLSSDDE